MNMSKNPRGSDAGFWLLSIVIVVGGIIIELNSGTKGTFLLTLFAALIFIILYHVFIKGGYGEKKEPKKRK